MPETNETKNTPAEEKPRAIHKLIEPIQTMGNDVTELHFKSLKGKMCRQYGYPFRMHTDGSYEMDGKKLSIMIEKYCNLAEGDADKLCEADHMQAGMVIMGFFMPS